MDNSLGLRKNDVELIIETVSVYPEVDEVIIFGSRATGNYKRGSDVDIAVKGERLNPIILNRIDYTLNEETVMPYKFDVLNYHSIQNKDLLEHIQRIGVRIYHRISLLP